MPEDVFEWFCLFFFILAVVLAFAYQQRVNQDNLDALCQALSGPQQHCRSERTVEEN